MRQFLLLLLLIISCHFQFVCAQVNTADSCDAGTPRFTFSLNGNPDSIWTSARIRRSGLCCQLDPTASPPIRCVQFFFTLDEEAQGIIFDIETGAKPPGSLGYSINCGEMHQVGEAICLSGTGPHWLTFCKPGNNPNTYSITSYPKPRVSPPIVVSDGCRGTLTAYGFVTSSIIWSSVPEVQSHNSYLSCTRACTTTAATYQKGAPPFVDYQVKGIPIGGCAGDSVIRTTRVYFVDNKKAQINPENPTICFGNNKTTITANITGGMPPYTYKWNTGETTPTIAAGTGKYWVEIQDNSSCPPAADTVDVTAFTRPAMAEAGPDTTICTGDTIVRLHGAVDINSGARWYGGEGIFLPDDSSFNTHYKFSSKEQNQPSVKLYLSTTGNGTCPPALDSVLVRFIPLSPVTTTDKTICIGGSTKLEANANDAGQYEWKKDGILVGTLNNLDVLNITNSTEYVVEFTNSHHCKSKDTVSVHTYPPPLLLLNDLQSCFGESVVLRGRPLNIPSYAKLNYEWYKDNLKLSVADTLVAFVQGRYILKASIGDCFTIDTAMVTQYHYKAYAGPDINLCTNESNIILNGSVTPAGGGAYWHGGNGAFAPNDSSLSTIYYPAEEEKQLPYLKLVLTTIISGSCVPDNDTMIIFFKQPNIFDILDDTLCLGSSIQLNAPQIAGASYQWIKNGIIVGKTGSLPVNSLQKDALYIVSLTNDFNCIHTDSVILKTYPLPDIKLRKSIACMGDLVKLNGELFNISYYPSKAGTYTWFKNNTMLQNNLHHLLVDQPGIYQVNYTIGSCMGKDTVHLHFHQAPRLELPDRFKFCKELDHSLTIDGGSGFSTYFWHPSGKTTQTLEVFNPGKYYLTVTNENNCFAYDSIEVREICPPRIYVPTVFTPQQDKNNKFVISGAHIKKFNLTIFNRWGEIIFYTENRLDYWDGTYKGEPMPIGVYPWLILYEGMGEEFKGEVKLQGSVTVVR